MLFHFFFFLWITCTAKAEFISINETNADGKAYILFGHAMSLTCEYYGMDIGKNVIEWYLPNRRGEKVGVNVMEKAYTQQEVVGKNIRLVLTVKDVTHKDAGDYVCRFGEQGQSGFTVKDIATVKVIVNQDVVVEDCPIDQWIPASLDESGNRNFFQKAEIRCKLQGLPPPTVRWSFKNQQLSTSNKYIINSDSLIIHGVAKDDEGIYTVRARQYPKIQSLSRNIRVVVFTKPRITVHPRIVGPFTDAVVDGYHAVLECRADGDPMPTIHWFKASAPDRELQLVSPSRFRVNSNPQVGQLRIEEAKFPEDNGEYICRAIVAASAIKHQLNDDMIAEQRIDINVNLRPKLVVASHRSFALGETATAHCQVRATEPVKLYFQKLYSPEPYVEGVQPADERITVTHTKEPSDHLIHNLYLEIKNSVFSDTWNYTCHVESPGTKERWNATVSIQQQAQFRPRVTERIPVHLDEMSDIRFGWRNNATNLTCAADVLPGVQWTWYRRGQQIVDTTNGTFRIISFDHWRWSQTWLQITPCYKTEYFIYDNYECRATNAQGVNKSVITFGKAAVPASPEIPWFTVDQSRIEIGAEVSPQDGGMPPLGYELHYRSNMGRQQLYGPVFFPLKSTRGIFLEGLVGQNEYTFELATRNLVGRSVPAILSIKTLKDATPSPVKCISGVMSGDPYSYTLRWRVPQNGGKPLLGYRLRMREVEFADGNWTTVSGMANELSRVELTAAEFMKRFKPEIHPLTAWSSFNPNFNTPYLDYTRLLDLTPERNYQIVIEGFNEHGFSLSSLQENEAAFSKAGFVPEKSLDGGALTKYVLEAASRRYQPVNQTDLLDSIPTWYLVRTPKAVNPDGRPLRVISTASDRPTHCLLFILFPVFVISFMDNC